MKFSIGSLDSQYALWHAMSHFHNHSTYEPIYIQTSIRIINALCVKHFHNHIRSLYLHGLCISIFCIKHPFNYKKKKHL